MRTSQYASQSERPVYSICAIRISTANSSRRPIKTNFATQRQNLFARGCKNVVYSPRDVAHLDPSRLLHLGAAACDDSRNRGDRRRSPHPLDHIDLKEYELIVNGFEDAKAGRFFRDNDVYLSPMAVQRDFILPEMQSSTATILANRRHRLDPKLERPIRSVQASYLDNNGKLACGHCYLETDLELLFKRRKPASASLHHRRTASDSSLPANPQPEAASPEVQKQAATEPALEAKGKSTGGRPRDNDVERVQKLLLSTVDRKGKASQHLPQSSGKIRREYGGQGTVAHFALCPTICVKIQPSVENLAALQIELYKTSSGVLYTSVKDSFCPSI